MNRLKLHTERSIEVSKNDIYKNDCLKFETSVKRTAQLINNTRPPFCIGITGEWGSGKTSFMRLLQMEMEVNYSNKSFWFDAWHYENESTLLIPLFSKMERQYKKHKTLLSQLKRSSAVLLLTGADVMLKTLTADQIKVDDIDKNFEIYEKTVEKAYEKWVDEVDVLRNNFVQLTNAIKKNSNAFIVFIDDLDRCLPENAIKLLENIKHFLAIDGSACVFIIGLDVSKIEKGIQAKYGNNLISGDEYLEKIFNIKLHVPSRSENSLLIQDMFSRLFDGKLDHQLNSEINMFSQIVSRVGTINPRRLKQIIIRYSFFLTQRDFSRFNREIVLKLIMLREYCLKIYTCRRKHNNVHQGASEDEKQQYSQDSSDVIANERLSQDSIKNLITYETDTLVKIKYGFNKELDELKRIAEQTNEEGQKQILNAMIDSSEERYHKEYFKLIEFLFTLAI